MNDPIITKEYVDGGMNVITTTKEFVPKEVLESRLLIAQQDLLEQQDLVDEITNDNVQIEQNQ